MYNFESNMIHAAGNVTGLPAYNSFDRETAMVKRAKELGVRVETLEEFFHSGIRLEQGGRAP